jgi:hypothetical protein
MCACMVRRWIAFAFPGDDCMKEAALVASGFTREAGEFRRLRVSRLMRVMLEAGYIVCFTKAHGNMT